MQKKWFGASFRSPAMPQSSQLQSRKPWSAWMTAFDYWASPQGALATTSLSLASIVMLGVPLGLALRA